jgi:hypothetical protein
MYINVVHFLNHMTAHALCKYAFLLGTFTTDANIEMGQAGQPGQIGLTGQPDWTARIGWPVYDRKDRTAGIGQLGTRVLEQDSQNMTARTGHLRQDNRDGTTVARQLV